MKKRSSKMTYFIDGWTIAFVASVLVCLVWGVVDRTTSLSEAERAVRPLFLGIAIWAPYFMAPFFATLYQEFHWELYHEEFDSYDWLDAAHRILAIGFFAGLLLQPLIPMQHFQGYAIDWLLLFFITLMPVLGAGSIYVLFAGMRSDKDLASNAEPDAGMIRSSVVYQYFKGDKSLPKL